MTEGAGRHQVVVMSVGGRLYAVPILVVGEIVPMVALTIVPEAPDWIAGMMNLRGRVLPVVDLRPRLGLPPLEYDLHTPIIVVQDRGRSLGLVADSVDAVVTVPDDDVERPDEVVASSLVAGVAKLEQRLIVELDLAPLVRGAEEALPEVPEQPADAHA